MSELIDRMALAPPPGAGSAAPTPPAPPATPERLIADENSQLSEIQGRWDVERAPVEASASAAADKLSDIAGTPVKTLPLPENMARHMDPKDLNQAASIFMTLGALGGLLTRRPMTAALNNMTAAMKGVQEGDADQYDRANAEFKQNFDKAMATNKAMLDEKEKALKDTNLTLTARMEQAKLIDAKYGNEAARATKTFDQQWKMIDSNRKAIAQAEATAQRLEMAQQRLSMERERLGMARERAAADRTAAAGIDPKTVDFYARQSLSGDNSWQVGLARGKVGQALIAAVKDRIPQMAAESGMTPQDASATKAQRDSIAKAMTDRQKNVAAAQQFVRNFKAQAELVEKYLEPGAAGSLPVFNKWIQAGRKATGDPDVAAYDTAIRGLAREHQRIVTGVTSNAQLHVSAQQTADELLNAAQSPEQVRAVLGVMREEADNAVDAGRKEVAFNADLLKHLGPQEKPKPTDADRAWAKQSPKNHDNYVKHFGVEP